MPREVSRAIAASTRGPASRTQGLFLAHRMPRGLVATHGGGRGVAPAMLDHLGEDAHGDLRGRGWPRCRAPRAC